MKKVIEKLPVKNPRDLDDVLRIDQYEKTKLGLLISNFLVT